MNGSSRDMRASVRAWSIALAVAAIATIAAIGFASCSTNTFVARSLVSTPRILAIVAEPPEINPGQLTALHAITGGTTIEPQFRWFVCARPEASATFTAQSTFGVATDDEGCFGDAAVQLGPSFDGPTYVFTVPANLFQNVAALRAIYGTSLSASALQAIVNVTGFPVTIAVQMTSGSSVVLAIKRVIVSGRTDTNLNPPAPSFRFGVMGDAGTGGIHLSGTADDPETCATDSGEPLTVRQSQAIQIAPDTNTADWLQMYDTLDSSNNIQHTIEVAYYSFFSTDGTYDDDRTRIPIQNTIWHAPAHAGPLSLWIIVRDGRGGDSGCRYTVNVR